MSNQNFVKLSLSLRYYMNTYMLFSWKQCISGLSLAFSRVFCQELLLNILKTVYKNSELLDLLLPTFSIHVYSNLSPLKFNDVQSHVCIGLLPLFYWFYPLTFVILEKPLPFSFLVILPLADNLKADFFFSISLLEESFHFLSKLS